MKRPYEKPTLIDLSLPTARAGRLPGGGVSPQGICKTGSDPGLGDAVCQTGTFAGFPTACNSGITPANQNFCNTGNGAT
jgi:hypothetical protein